MIEVELSLPVYVGAVRSKRIVSALAELLAREGVRADKVTLRMPTPADGKVEQKVKVND